MPYTQDPAELEGVDVAIVGAPTDDLVSDRPGARFGPRGIRAASCPPGPHLEAGVDGFAELRVVDFGDAPVLPADAARTHEAIESTVGEVLDAGALPIVLGGDHGIAEPDIRACAARHGPVGLVHFDTHTDTGTEVFGVEISHGTPMYRLVEAGLVDPPRYVQIGLRGYWPGEKEFGWQRERGITSFFMHQVRDQGIEWVLQRALEVVGEGPVFLSVDVDVLDPAFAPGTGHARARRHDRRRPAVGLPPLRRAHAAGGRRPRRGDPHRGRLGGHDLPGGRPGGQGGGDGAGARATAPGIPATSRSSRKCQCEAHEVSALRAEVRRVGRPAPAQHARSAGGDADADLAEPALDDVGQVRRAVQPGPEHGEHRPPAVGDVLSDHPGPGRQVARPGQARLEVDPARGRSERRSDA